jgi:hypothetical protein
LVAGAARRAGRPGGRVSPSRSGGRSLAGPLSHAGSESLTGRMEQKALNTVKDLFDIAQALATVIAIGVGGAWSYLLFVRTRQKYPRAKLEHKITHRNIPDGKILLHVGVTISNEGDVLLSLISTQTRIQKVLPVADHILDSIKKGEDPVEEGKTEIEWPLIGSSRKSEWEEGQREIEPGESDELIYDFIIDSGIQTVEVYTYVKNASKKQREIGWPLTTIYDIRASSRESKLPFTYYR